MTLPLSSSDPTFRIYLSLAQIPILRTRVRARMQNELFERGIITPQEFEAQVRARSIESQASEGLIDPLVKNRKRSGRPARIACALT